MPKCSIFSNQPQKVFFFFFLVNWHNIKQKKKLQTGHICQSRGYPPITAQIISIPKVRLGLEFCVFAVSLFKSLDKNCTVSFEKNLASQVGV